MKKLTFIILVIVQLGTLLFTACGRMGAVPPPDKTPPVVNAISPLNGAIDFPVTGTITITFSKVMDPSSIDGSTIAVASDIGALVAGSFTTTGAISVFTPSQNLSENTRYKVTVSTGVKDSYGIAATTDEIFYFTTLSFPPPKVVDIQPANRAKNQSLNAAISILFSEPMDPNSITGTNNIKVSNVAGNFSGKVLYNEALGAATFYPDIVFSSNTNYNVTVTTGVTDQGKIPLTDAFVSTFQTGAAGDSTAPTVQSTVPSNTATNISVNTPISVTFSEPMDLLTITPSNFIVSQGTVTIPGNIKNYGNTIVFTPTNPLAYLTPYTATISTGVTDLAGIPLQVASNNNTWQFTTVPQSQSPDAIQPSVLATWPTSTQNNVPVYNQVVALFSESMLASSITPTTFVLVNQNDPNKVPVPGQVKTNGAAAIFIPSQNLAYNTTYTATIISAATPTMTLGATDLAGNPLGNSNSPAGYNWNFTTEAPASFTISATAGPNGSISPAGSVVVNINTSQTFTITPATGYHINDVLVDGSSVGAVSSYTFSSVTSDHTINASFAINTSTITATAGANGSISPSGAVSVNYGASQMFTFLSATGYHVFTVTVDGTPLGAPLSNSYTFSNVKANHTIVVSFAINTYKVTPSVSGGNGTISPTAPQTVNYNGATSFTLTPTTAGYHLVTPVGGTCGGTLAGDGITYTTAAVTSDCTVQASFAINTYSINFVSGGNGTLTGTTSQTVNYGGSTTAVTATPSTGYHFVNWTGTGGFVTTTANPLTVTNVTASQNITANFAINAFTITTSASANGSISPIGPVTVNYGATQTFTFTPNPGYYVSAITVNIVGQPSTPVPLANSYTFTNVTANWNIAVSFANNMYQIGVTTTPGAGGTITPGTTLLPYGGNQTFTIQANAGYQIANVLADGYSVGSVTSYAFTNVQSNHTLEARFSPILVITTAGNGSGTVTGAGAYTYVATATVTAAASTGSTFTGWTGACTGTVSPTTVLMDGPKTCTATFMLNPTLTVNMTGTGSGTVTGAGVYPYGATATVTAVASTGSTFTGWTGACTGTISPTTVLMDANKTCTANFAINTYTVNFASGGNGTLTGTTSQTVNYGSPTTPVTAVPATGYSFVNWTGDNGFVTTTANPLTIASVTASQNITANFAINTFTLTVTMGGTGTGTVTADSGSITWNGNSGKGTATYNYGTVVTLTATPDPSSTFNGWTNCDSVNVSGQCIVNMTAAKSVTATF